MNQNKDLTIKEAFDLALKNHQEGRLDVAQELYNQVLKIDPNDSTALNNLGNLLHKLGKSQKAKDCFEKAIEIDPSYMHAHYNLGILFNSIAEIPKAKDCFEKAIEIDPSYVKAHYSLGIVFKNLGKNQKAKDCFEKAIEIDPNFIDAHNTLGGVFNVLGDHQKAINCYEKAIAIDPDFAAAHNNLGILFNNIAEIQKAIDCFEKAIAIDPNLTEAHWNLQGVSSNIDASLSILKKLYEIDNKHIQAKIIISALEGYKGNFGIFDEILSSDPNHPYTRSIKWVFSQPKLPKIFFNRWDFFDNIIKLSDNSRPFYEFGVWNGISFQYLINTIKKGFGFDTFTGIPEDWHTEAKNSYSSFGVVPKIEGGKFIVGKFEDTLPEFFFKERPMASLINFDADLYSSTLCALKNSNKIIDEKTILIFDEFLMNNKWEDDEYKALNEFCDNLGFNYEVLAISFNTKQVAVKLKNINETRK